MFSLFRICNQPITFLQSLKIVEISLQKKSCFLKNAVPHKRFIIKMKDTEEQSLVSKNVEITQHGIDPTAIWSTGISSPDPKLPKNISEVSFLDPSHSNQVTSPVVTGDKRRVHIKQMQAQVSQSPLRVEHKWVLSFQDEGESAQCWENPLMGWVSSSDPLSTNLRSQITFNNASDAVYFAKKCGWNFIVEEPIFRKLRSDDTSYQDNFLPQDISEKVKRENTKCDQWCRELGGTSHYFRPLKYHGHETVCQHGPDGNNSIRPHVKGSFSLK